MHVVVLTKDLGKFDDSNVRRLDLVLHLRLLGFRYRLRSCRLLFGGGHLEDGSLLRLRVRW
jgi:hypothetical protein